MNRCISIPCFLIIFLFLSVPVSGQTEPNNAWTHPKVATQLRLDMRSSSTEDHVTLVTLRFTHPLSRAELEEFRGKGILFDDAAFSPRHLGTFYGARLSTSTLNRVIEEPRILRILPAAPAMIFPQQDAMVFDKTHDQTTANQVWNQRDINGDRIRGKGITFVDIDGGLDVFHPLFFRMDGGFYSWIDVDGDLAFSPDIDAVDLDEDGLASEGETLRAMGGELMDKYTNEVVLSNPMFSVGRDWLYADTNNNNKRGAGASKGFTEETPAYGEPLFAVDDVNKNGILDPQEKLVRLGSSKVRGLIHMYTGEVFERGVNLVEAPRNPPSGSHATGVNSILLGGNPDYTKVYGVATDAEVIMIDAYVPPPNPENAVGFGEALPSVLTTALEWGGNVFVHEYGSHFGEFADGGSDWEVLLNEYSENGIVQATANHNFAGTNGHAIFPVPGWETIDVSFQKHDMTGTGYDPAGAFGTIRWLDGDLESVSISLITPMGELSLDEEGEGINNDKVYTYTTRSTSSRDTKMVSFMLYKLKQNNQTEALETGEYFLRITNNQAEDLTIHAHFSDDSGYSYAVNFNEFQTDAGTMAPPSTADSAISVGAYMGNHVLVAGEILQQLRYYSGRGPRIDGVQGADITAPDDHYTGSVYTPWNGGGNYTIFGGTSGALPQVAGAIALYKQTHPEATPNEIREAIHATSITDEQTGEVPNTEWGYGRIGTHHLVMGSPPTENLPPQVIIQLPGLSIAGEETVLDASASSDTEDLFEDLIFRWDLDYDGLWDAEQQGIGDLTAIFDQPGPTWVKMEVEDTKGATAAQLFQVDVMESTPPVVDTDPIIDAGSTDILEEDVNETDIFEQADSEAQPDAEVADGSQPPPSDITSPENNDIARTDPPPSNSSDDRGCRQTQGGDSTPWMAILFSLWILFLPRWRRGIQSRHSPSGGPPRR